MAQPTLIDTRSLVKLGTFDGRHEEWQATKFDLMNYLALIHIDLPTEMDVAAAREGPITVPADNAEVLQRSRVLFAVLAAWMAKGKPKLMARTIFDRNGYEYWRQLCVEYEPRFASRALIQLRGISTWQLSGNEDELEVRLMALEQKVEEYERQHHKQVDEDMLKAMLLTESPLQQYLSVYYRETMAYAAVRELVTNYLRSRKSWNSSQSPTAMDVDALVKGKSKGKGKDRKR